MARREFAQVPRDVDWLSLANHRGRMHWIDLCGYLAAIFTTIANLPQAIRTWRTRSTRDLSLGTLALLATGLFLWLVYGIARADLPLIIGNAVALVLTATVPVYKVRHG